MWMAKDGPRPPPSPHHLVNFLEGAINQHQAFKNVLVPERHPFPAGNENGAEGRKGGRRGWA